MFKSIGESTYNAFTATLTKRMKDGWQAQVTYTLARGTDNAPLTGTYVVGSNDDRVSDPSNLDRDKGVTPFNQTHTLAVSAVLAPHVTGDGMRRDAAEQQPARRSFFRRTAACRSISARTCDLNGDGVNNDRPLGVERNTGRLAVGDPRPALLAIHPDPACARRGVLRGEESVQPRERAGVNRVVTTDALGVPAGAIPSIPRTAGYDQRHAARIQAHFLGRWPEVTGGSGKNHRARAS